ncbi:anthranilate phosphoribosyltransferase [Candidatus Palauibacter sp.]|uniref:anthranilate phosphoribosyltransferase n=1 Tax=Candidatus Palauibacter sp. TaxID=3101350 RepID=UPI003B5B7081
MDTIRRVLSGETLDVATAEAAFDRFMSGEATPAEMAALLTGLRMRGETPAEVAGGVRALRKAMVPLELDDDRIIDTCGTGGGTLTTFNISTAASIVAVAGGVRIAKHGNRSFTSKCGSADVLETLGVPIQLPLEDEKRMFEETGFAFMFAPAHHPAMRHVGPVRAGLGVTTIMNLLGPLANPAGVRRQVVGVAHAGLQRLVADALLELGHERALVVHGEPGMDELSPLGPTRVFQVENGTLSEFEVTPSGLGWPDYDPGDLAGGEPAENAERVRRVVCGTEGGAGRAAVVLNAAAAFWVAGTVDTLAEGVAAAERAIDSGAARDQLEVLQAFEPGVGSLR